MIPGWRTILCEHSDEICQTIIFPDIRKEEFIKVYSECLQTKSKEDSSRAPSSPTHSEVLNLFIGEESKDDSEGEIHRDSLPTLSERHEVDDEENEESLEKTH